MTGSECGNGQTNRIVFHCNDINRIFCDSSSSNGAVKSIPKSSSAKQLTDKSHTLSPTIDNKRSGTCNNLNAMTPLPISPLASTSHQSSIGTVIESGSNSGHPLIPNNRMRRNESSCSVTIAEELQISRRPSVLIQEILSTRRPSAIMAALRTQGYSTPSQRPRIMGSLHEDPNLHGSCKSINTTGHNSNGGGPGCDLALQSRKKNRRIGDDALSTALSALYCKLIVILGIAMPVTEIISSKIPTDVYQGFYVYLYLGSIAFVIFVYVSHMKTRALVNILKSYHEKTNNVHIKRRADHFGSFYLRVGAIAFGIGTMVYSGLEFGQYFELNGIDGCKNIFIALTPAARMALSIFQMQFIFLNTTELDMARHKVIARFGLMHMVATNLCEWLYVLVEETKHEIFHFMHAKPSAAHIDGNREIFSNNYSDHIAMKSVSFDMQSTLLPIINDNTNYPSTDWQIGMNVTNTTEELLSLTKRSEAAAYINCQRTNIMGSLVQDASPFLFPCTIEYSLICAVILYEMWKRVKSIPDIAKTRKFSQKTYVRSAHHFSVDCSRAHRGLFAGILIIVMTIICLIMYFVLHEEPGYEFLAVQEVTICEILMYTMTSVAVVTAMVKMRDLKFHNKVNDKHAGSISLDCTLLVLAQTGVYVYGMFSIMGSYFSIAEGAPGSNEGLVAEVIGLFQTSIQTLFILNSYWRRCKGAQQQRIKPGRETITFLLVANVSMWFINTLIKGRAAFRSSHVEFFGVWAWTIITHVSMPLAIFYRFHSTICLFEIWKSAYKTKP